MANQICEVRDPFFLYTLRNCGYNNYSAISDIIDNSIEPDVGCNTVHVFLGYDSAAEGGSKAVTSIQVADDGSGMTMATLHEAMALGSQTGKTSNKNLGMYGTGLKTASFSMGQILEVYTKTADSDKVNYAQFSLEDALLNQGPVKLYFAEYALNDPAVVDFATLVGDHGTIVKITKLDRLTNKEYGHFRGKLKRRLAENFNKYIRDKVVKILVEGEEVPYIDLMGTKDLIASGEFDVEGHTIKYKAWNLPKMGGVKESDKDDALNVTADGETLGRTSRNQGIYIYRQNRLVGRGLTLGMWVRHNSSNGFRCEIFVDGSCDYMFGSTFTKTVTEQMTENLNQEFLAKLTNAIEPLRTQVEKQEEQRKAAERKSDPKQKAKTDQLYKNVTAAQNNNMMLSANRNDAAKWLDGFREQSMGRAGEMFAMNVADNKKIILINSDHPFYTEIYSKMDDDLKFRTAQAISCIEIVKQKVNYYGSTAVATQHDTFLEQFSLEVGKSLG